MFTESGNGKALLLLAGFLTAFALFRGCSRLSAASHEDSQVSQEVQTTKTELDNRLNNFRSQSQCEPGVTVTDRRSMAEWVIRNYMYYSGTSSIRNPSDPREAMHVFGKVGDKMGAIYLDPSEVDPVAGGDIVVTGQVSSLLGPPKWIIEKVPVDFDPPPPGDFQGERMMPWQGRGRCR